MYNKLFWECDLWSSSICSFFDEWKPHTGINEASQSSISNLMIPKSWKLSSDNGLPLLPEEGSWVWPLRLYQIPFPQRQDLVFVGFVPGTHHRHSCWAWRPQLLHAEFGRHTPHRLILMTFINQTSSSNAIVYYLKIMIEWWRSSNQSHKGQESCQKRARDDNPIEFSARCCATGSANHLELWLNL